MPTNREQKIRLLVLYDILYRMSDEENALTSDELVEELAKRGISVARRIIASDIELLNEYGYEVLSYKKKYYYYYVADRRFERAEISMLADAVKATKLNRSQKEKIGFKLSEELGNNRSEAISKCIINCDAPKHSNSQILYSIDAIEEAISHKKKISFLYYSLDVDKNKVYRKDGKRYVVNPLVMVWSKDNYYVICYHDNHDGTATYRIDRMEKVRIEDCDITPKKEFEDFNVEQYRTQVFSMFNGELNTVELEFTYEMLSDIYDRFGEDINVKCYTDNKYRINVPIRISPNFFLWILGSKGKVRIISPVDVKENFNQFFNDIKEQY